MEQRLYFAYGSNINLEQMKRRCPDARPIAPVMLRDYELSFRGSGVATIIPKRGATAHGLMWDLTPECEQALDIYEAYPRLYGKKDVTVRDKSGSSYSVMAYIMTPGYAEQPADPPRGYFIGILEGYKQNGMPTQPLFKALWNTRNEMHERESQNWQQSFIDRRNGRSNYRKPPSRSR